MRKFLSPIIILCLWLSASLQAFAQIPYYAGTVGDGKLYGYTTRPLWREAQQVV